MHRKTATLARPATESLSSKPHAAVVPGLGDLTHNGKVEDAIRLRAYEKWESAGKPIGDGVQFWLAAEKELKALLSPALPNEEVISAKHVIGNRMKGP